MTTQKCDNLFLEVCAGAGLDLAQLWSFKPARCVRRSLETANRTLMSHLSAGICCLPSLAAQL